MTFIMDQAWQHHVITSIMQSLMAILYIKKKQFKKIQHLEKENLCE